jgi:hypothetical protein
MVFVSAIHHPDIINTQKVGTLWLDSNVVV